MLCLCTVYFKYIWNSTAISGSTISPSSAAKLFGGVYLGRHLLFRIWGLQFLMWGKTPHLMYSHYWDHYPGALSLSQVTATHLKIGHQWFPCIVAQFLNELQGLNYTMGCKDNTPGNRLPYPLLILFFYFTTECYCLLLLFVVVMFSFIVYMFPELCHVYVYFFSVHVRMRNTFH